MNEIKVMSFNLRVANPFDGINCFENRKCAIGQMLAAQSPDLIGFQEAVTSSAEWLQSTFGGRYVILGCGRGTNYDGESCPVAFKKDKFDLISFETVWLSDTPCVPGSFYLGTGQSNCPRLLHKVFLKVKSGGQVILFINTHLDHMGTQARLKGAEQIYALMRDMTVPGFITGDFNALPDSREITFFSEKLGGIGWRDATNEVGGTCHAFGKVVPAKIDYIFTNTRTSGAYAVEATLDGVFLSDHAPVCVDASL